MQRVHEMILAEVGANGLDAARGRLKKTLTTTVVRADGTRLAEIRCADGTIKEAVQESRLEDMKFLGLAGDSIMDVSTTNVLETQSTRPETSFDSDVLDTLEAPRFDVEDASFLDHLKEHGYVVVKDVASPTDRLLAEDHLWQFLSKHASFVRDDPTTWNDANFELVGCTGTGIIDGAGIGQSDFLWQFRLLPNVRKAFAAIWATNDLLTSFDGANVFRPWQRTEFCFAKTLGGWYHVDQGRGKSGLESVQGFVSLFDANASTGGFVVIPGSQKRHGELVRHQYTESNYFSPPASDPILEMPKKMITCCAGDLVLWDSRCLHCSAPARVAAVQVSSGPPRLLRAVAYMCMTPKAKASEEVLKQRREAYASRLTTSHWPHLFSTVRAGKELKAGNEAPLSFNDAPLDRRALIS